jgi:uncharacterized sporulation protein YeaH/YhbH (DUF444 family)
MSSLSLFARRARLATSLSTSTISPIYSRTFTHTAINMGVTKKLISPGNGQDKPKKGDSITMEYTGNLYDQNATDGKGKQFDSSVGRGDFNTKIGVGQLIKGMHTLLQEAELQSLLRRYADTMQVGTRASSRPTAACPSARRPLSSSLGKLSHVYAIFSQPC